MPVSLPAIAFGTTSVAYGAFAVYLATGPRTWVRTLLTAAAAITALWAASAIFADASVIPANAPDLLGTLRDAAWFGVVLAIIRKADRNRSVWPMLAIAIYSVVSLHLLFIATHIDLGRVLGITIDSATVGVVESVAGLILIENMMRNLPGDQFWSTKHLGIALIAFLTLELLSRIPQFITGLPLGGLAVTRPLLLTMLLPLFAVSAARSPALELRLPSSRTVAFRTATVVGAGVILEGAAIAAYYLRNIGGDNGTVLAIVFGFAAAVGTALALTSGSARSRARAFINENFFSYKYDYRVEWSKFIRALSAHEDGDMPLRVLRTLAELLDSTGGVLWVLRDRWHQFMPVAHWSISVQLAPFKLDDPCIAAFADEELAFIELTTEQNPNRADPWRQRFAGSWLAVPLRYRGQLVAIALINPPRAPRKLDWEDRNLISLVALQLGAYLVQEEMVQALADARQLEEFNKRFAFILHDTKNAIGQLSLLVRNVEQFGHVESFRQDMTQTLRHSVDKLQQLLAQLRGEAATPAAKETGAATVNVTALVVSFVRGKRKLGLDVVVDEEGPPITAVMPDKDAFLGVLDLVVTNAIEASPSGSSVTVQVRQSGNNAEVKVIDRGPGMSQEFIARELFRPLRSTKKGGFGIGAYQAREVMGKLGGKLDIDSKIGEGTTISLSVPAVESHAIAGAVRASVDG